MGGGKVSIPKWGSKLSCVTSMWVGDACQLSRWDEHPQCKDFRWHNGYRPNRVHKKPGDDDDDGDEDDDDDDDDDDDFPHKISESFFF